MSTRATNGICDGADIDECATNNGGCIAEANCTNTEGNFVCTCPPGYTGDGFTCTGKQKTSCNVVPESKVSKSLKNIK